MKLLGLLVVVLVLTADGAAAQIAPDPRFGIDEGLSDAAMMAEMGAGWDRVLVPWYRIQPRGPDDFSGLGRALPDGQIRDEAARGVRVAGVLHYTPGWAARNPEDGLRAVPRDPDEFGRFVYQTVRFYAGQIDEWIVWNEPDFRPGDLPGDSAVTWLGTDEELAALIKAAYVAAKQADPRATVSFPATSTWIDVNNNRPLLYARVLAILAADPDAANNGFYHDAVSVNLYHRPDEIYNAYALFKDIQLQYGIDKPVWLTETNSMPVNDTAAACWERHTPATEPFPTTLREQAAFAVQALASAAAAGYQRIGFWRMIDGLSCQQPGLWGAIRDDDSPRPVALALRAAIHAFSGFSQADLSRDGPVTRVVFDNGRLTVLWNTSGTPVSVQVSASRAQTMLGDDLRVDGAMTLEPATAHVPSDPPGTYYIGGPPLLLFD